MQHNNPLGAMSITLSPRSALERFKAHGRRCEFCTNTMPLSMMDLSIHGSWRSRWVLESVLSPPAEGQLDTVLWYIWWWLKQEGESIEGDTPHATSALGCYFQAKPGGLLPTCSRFVCGNVKADYGLLLGRCSLLAAKSCPDTASCQSLVIYFCP